MHVAPSTSPVAGFAQRALAARTLRGPLVVGVDPSAALLSDWGLGDDGRGLGVFCDTVLEAARGRCGIIKPQSAFFERLGAEGILRLEELIRAARGEGILVILDAKRGDVGSTNQAYAESCLGPAAPLSSDAVTLSAYLGLEAMEEFWDRCSAHGTGAFVVVRSSNPEGRSLQSALTCEGPTVEKSLIEGIGRINRRLSPEVPGPVGAVVGATWDATDLPLGDLGGLILAPGVGAQGAAPEQLADRFGPFAGRVLASASRTVLRAGPEAGRLADTIESLNQQLGVALGLAKEPPGGGAGAAQRAAADGTVAEGTVAEGARW